MGTVYLMSDLHDGHKAIGKYRSSIAPEVTGVEENREFIRSHWRAKKHDKVFMLGDVAFAPDSDQFIKSLPAFKDLVLGNHELENRSRANIYQLAGVFNNIYGITKWKALGQKFWLTHAPMHPCELRGHKNIHGHIHSAELDLMNKGTPLYDSNFINVNIDVLYPRTGKIMITVDEIEEYMKGF